MDLLNYTENELITTVEKAINADEIKAKLTKASQRIQSENKISQVATKIVHYLDDL